MWCILNDQEDQREVDANKAKKLTTEIDGIISHLKENPDLPIEKVKLLCDEVTEKSQEIDEIVSKYID